MTKIASFNRNFAGEIAPVWPAHTKSTLISRKTPNSGKCCADISAIIFRSSTNFCAHISHSTDMEWAVKTP